MTVASQPVYAPAYKDSAFQQGLTPGRPWVLIPGQGDHRRLGAIRYRDAETGEEMLVPNVWGNQPAKWRADAFRFYLREAEEGVRRLKAGLSEPWRIADAEARLPALQALVAQYQALDDAGAYPREA